MEATYFVEGGGHVPLAAWGLAHECMLHASQAVLHGHAQSQTQATLHVWRKRE